MMELTCGFCDCSVILKRGHFLCLLGAVVAVVKEGLKVVPVSGQRRVPVVCLDVVNVFAGIAAKGTAGVQADELSPSASHRRVWPRWRLLGRLASCLRPRALITKSAGPVAEHIGEVVPQGRRA